MKTTIIVLVVASFWAIAPAGAQTDPDPDGLGFYADPGGLTNRLDAPPGFVEVHLLGTHIDAIWIKGWGTRFNLDGNAYLTKFNTPYPCLTISGQPDPHTYEYIVDAYPDLPRDETEITGGDIVHLATLELYLFDGEPVDIYVGPTVGILPGSVPAHWYYYLKDGVYRSIETEFHPSTGNWDIPVMTINGESAVPVEPATWSGVRALYR